MNWNDDAVVAVGKAPFFVRGMIRRKAEEFVSKQGRDTITLADVEELRNKTMAGSELHAEAQADPQEETFHGGLTAKQIERIIENTRVQVLSDSRFYEVKVCGGAFGCPRTLFDVRGLADKVIAVVEEAGVPEGVEKRTKGPVLKHHKFCVSISGCPNSCSQPQIADFGVQGRAKPVLALGICHGCGECVRVCKEDAVAIPDNTPTFNRDRCIDCGDCAAVCPTQAIVIEQYGYGVLAGGKLGRHPQLAQTLFDFANEDTLLASLRVACEVFANEMLRDERFAHALDRIGVGEMRDRSMG